jgi:hypothetical protein
MTNDPTAWHPLIVPARTWTRVPFPPPRHIPNMWIFAPRDRLLFYKDTGAIRTFGGGDLTVSTDPGVRLDDI